MQMPLASLKAVAMIVPDLPRAVAFYTNVWGLRQVAVQDGTVYLAASGRDSHVLELTEGVAVALARVTFRCHSAQSLDSLAAGLAAGAVTELRPVGPANHPFGGRNAIFQHAQGLIFELVHGDATKAPEIRANTAMRLAHVNLNTTDVTAFISFFEQDLGMRFTDQTRFMSFLTTDQDHHCVVLAHSPINGLNHVAFMMPDLESVMRGSGQVVLAGTEIAWGVGRHGPGDNVFAYFIDPFGTVIEYTAEVLQIDESYVIKRPEDWDWPPGRIDHWGICPPKSDHCKAAQLAVPYATGSHD
jgi:catechol 2,3-dioxygenase-like lactoylglutathione lyase family enzyme